MFFACIHTYTHTHRWMMNEDKNVTQKSCVFLCMHTHIHECRMMNDQYWMQNGECWMMNACIYIYIYMYIYIYTHIHAFIMHHSSVSIHHSAFSIGHSWYGIRVCVCACKETHRSFYVIFLWKIDQKWYPEQPWTAPGTDRIGHFTMCFGQFAKKVVFSCESDAHQCHHSRTKCMPFFGIEGCIERFAGFWTGIRKVRKGPCSSA